MFISYVMTKVRSYFIRRELTRLRSKRYRVENVSSSHNM